MTTVELMHTLRLQGYTCTLELQGSLLSVYSTTHSHALGKGADPLLGHVVWPLGEGEVTGVGIAQQEGLLPHRDRRTA